MAESVGERGERALLAEIRRRVPRRGRVRWGPGDDAALVAPSPRPLLLTTDALVEGVHFRRGWLRPRVLGRRAFEVNASDIAAMGGRPVAALLAITARPDFPAADLRDIVTGVRDRARATGAALAGGNLAAGPILSLTVAVLGDVPSRAVGRAGARPGDRLFVTGTLGGAALGLRTLLRPHVRRGRYARARSAWQRPLARLRAGQLLARRDLAGAMIDVSDGLVIDAERLCEASGVGAILWVDRLPLAGSLDTEPRSVARWLALTGGEDYELLFAVGPARVPALLRARASLGCPVTEIGEVVRGHRVRVVDARGRPVALPARRGHVHFTER
jgi:thiamine-monophosphate kinase